MHACTRQRLECCAQVHACARLSTELLPSAGHMLGTSVSSGATISVFYSSTAGGGPIEGPLATTNSAPRRNPDGSTMPAGGCLPRCGPGCLLQWCGRHSERQVAGRGAGGDPPAAAHEYWPCIAYTPNGTTAAGLWRDVWAPVDTCVYSIGMCTLLRGSMWASLGIKA